MAIDRNILWWKWQSIAIICSLLIASTLAGYWPVLSCEFISLDDAEYVYKNPQVLSGLSLAGWRYAWTTWDCSNWHPLTWLSLELDASLCGKNPAGYHATNMLLHAVNSVLFFLVLQRLTRALYPSAWAAAFFALHPLHVESVAWVSERKDVLSTLLLLLTIWAYVHYAERPSWARYWRVSILLTFGLLAKPMLVTVPILLLLLDGWPLDRISWGHSATSESRFPRRPFHTVLLEKLPLLVLAFADGLMTIVAQMGAVKLMVDVTLGTRIANLFNAYAWYLQKTFVPLNLIFLYPHPETNLSWVNVAIGVLVFGAISIWVYRRRASSPHLLFGWLWFVISLLPVIGLIQVGMQAYADRYAYIPHLGLFIAIVWECYARSTTKVRQLAIGCVGLTALIACGVLTRIQVGFWQNNETLWGHALAVNPNNGFAHAHYADVQMAKGDYERAIFHIENILKWKRSGYIPNAYCNWGRCLIELKRPAEAEQKFLMALQLDPNHEASLEEMAKLLKTQGRASEAAQYLARHAEVFGRRLAQMPENAAVQFKLGMLMAQQGNAKQAAVHFEKAVELAPQSAEARNNLGLVQMQLNRRQEAKANFLRAIELNHQLGNSHYFLANLLEGEKDFAGAKEHLAEAVRINPKDVKAQQALDRLNHR